MNRQENEVSKKKDGLNNYQSSDKKFELGKNNKDIDAQRHPEEQIVDSKQNLGNQKDKKN